MYSPILWFYQKDCVPTSFMVFVPHLLPLQGDRVTYLVPLTSQEYIPASQKLDVMKSFTLNVMSMNDLLQCKYFGSH